MNLNSRRKEVIQLELEEMRLRKEILIKKKEAEKLRVLEIENQKIIDQAEQEKKSFEERQQRIEARKVREEEAKKKNIETLAKGIRSILELIK